MKTYELVFKPMTLTIIKSKKTEEEYFKLCGLIPVKENNNTLFSANNTGATKFSTCEIFDKTSDVIGIQDVIDKFDTVKKLNLSGFWNKGGFSVVSVKVVE